MSTRTPRPDRPDRRRGRGSSSRRGRSEPGRAARPCTSRDRDRTRPRVAGATPRGLAGRTRRARREGGRRGARASPLRARGGASADDRRPSRLCGAAPGTAERSTSPCPGREKAGDRVDASYLERLLDRERREGAGSRRASIVFPVPGGPPSRRLCRPAAASSSARRARSWPRTSARSGPPAPLPQRPAARRARGSKLPRRYAPASARCSHRNRLDPGQSSLRRGLRRTDETVETCAPRRLSGDEHPGNWPEPAVERELSDRGVLSQALRRESGATRRAPPARLGGRNPSPPCQARRSEIHGDAPERPLELRARYPLLTRSFASWHALSGRPTIANAGTPRCRCASTSTGRASRPTRAWVMARASTSRSVRRENAQEPRPKCAKTSCGSTGDNPPAGYVDAFLDERSAQGLLRIQARERSQVLLPAAYCLEIARSDHRALRAAPGRGDGRPTSTSSGVARCALERTATTSKRSSSSCSSGLARSSMPRARGSSAASTRPVAYQRVAERSVHLKLYNAYTQTRSTPLASPADDEWEPSISGTGSSSRASTSQPQFVILKLTTTNEVILDFRGRASATGGQATSRPGRTARDDLQRRADADLAGTHVREPPARSCQRREVTSTGIVYVARTPRNPAADVKVVRYFRHDRRRRPIVADSARPDATSGAPTRGETTTGASTRLLRPLSLRARPRPRSTGVHDPQPVAIERRHAGSPARDAPRARTSNAISSSWETWFERSGARAAARVLAQLLGVEGTPATTP